MLTQWEVYLGSKLNEDVGKLVLRASLAVLMLFHGFAKALHGVDGIAGLLERSSLPGVLAYMAYFGEIIIPVMLLLGVLTRLSAVIYVVNMIFAVVLAFGWNLLSLTKMGGLVSELALLHLLGALALVFLGAGKYSLDYRFLKRENEL